MQLCFVLHSLCPTSVFQTWWSRKTWISWIPHRLPSRCLCRLATPPVALVVQRSTLPPDTLPSTERVASTAVDATLLALPFPLRFQSLQTESSGSLVTSTGQYLPTCETLLFQSRTVVCPGLCYLFQSPWKPVSQHLLFQWDLGQQPTAEHT